MKDLLDTGAEANRAYAFAGALGAFALAVAKEGISTTHHQVFWFVVFVALLVLALAALYFGHRKQCAGKERLEEIKAQTKHD